MSDAQKTLAGGFVILAFLILLAGSWAVPAYRDWADTPRGPVVVETAATLGSAEWATLEAQGVKAAINSGAVDPQLVESRYRPRDGIATLILKGSHETDGTICMTVKATHYRERLNGKWFDDVDPYADVDRVECPS